MVFGRAVADKLAQLGIHALVVGRNEERGEKTIAAIRAAGGQARLHFDLTFGMLRVPVKSRDARVELGDGHVDILINNAGGLSVSARRMKRARSRSTRSIRST